jgi:hypothetical protein
MIIWLNKYQNKDIVYTHQLRICILQAPTISRQQNPQRIAAYVMPNRIPTNCSGNGDISKNGVSESVKKNNAELMMIIAINHTIRAMFL